MGYWREIWQDNNLGYTANNIQGKNATGERYLPKKARESLSDEEYARSTAKKRAAMRKGKQFSKQPDDVAKKTSKYRR